MIFHFFQNVMIFWGHPNEECPSLENAKLCEDNCISEVENCLENCGADCNYCQRDFFACTDGMLNIIKTFTTLHLQG